MLLDERQRIDSAILRNDAQKITLPIRLQAYERLTLLCDRAGVLNTIMRVRMPGMNVVELRAALMMAISQEFDHNTSQQLYVSETLWKIMRLAKQDTLNIVTTTGEDLDPGQMPNCSSGHSWKCWQEQEQTISKKPSSPYVPRPGINTSDPRIRKMKRNLCLFPK
jgi:hypothetical protein